jgi:hypothetical protein
VVQTCLSNVLTSGFPVTNPKFGPDYSVLSRIMYFFFSNFTYPAMFSVYPLRCLLVPSGVCILQVAHNWSDVMFGRFLVRIFTGTPVTLTNICRGFLPVQTNFRGVPQIGHGHFHPDNFPYLYLFFIPRYVVWILTAS